jgi:cytochrome c nitrite reductase small subunit
MSAQDPNRQNPRWLLPALLVAAGTAGGIGLFTFEYAEGLSYFSTDPAACANCHIMQPQYDSWQMASHHTVATCVDCHLPHDFVGKYIAKAENGYHHSVGFTLQNFQEPIRIKSRNRRLLHDNCLSCHEDLVHELVPGEPGDANFLECVHCHSDVGHGPRSGLGGPETNSEQNVP